MSMRRLTAPAEERATKAAVSAVGAVTKRTHFGIGKNRWNPIIGERYMYAHYYGTRSIGNDKWYPRRWLPEFKAMDVRFLLLPLTLWWWTWHAAVVFVRDPTKALHPFALNTARIDAWKPENYASWDEGKHRYDGDPTRAYAPVWTTNYDTKPEDIEE